MQKIEFPPIKIKVEGLECVEIPKMMKIRQLYDAHKIEDLRTHTQREIETKIHDLTRFAGKRICVTAGSRGIPHQDTIIRAICDKLKEYGAKPFIVPAMGSHGGGTTEGQVEMIAGYNITEASMGVPILASMEVVQISTLEDGTPVYCDKYAAESDGIVIFNKVKPHTNFRGRHESGMAKMMAIGLAKHKGASMFHMQGFHTFAKRIPEVCGEFLRHAPIAFGIGLVQNAYDEISDLEACEPEDILEVDARLLEVAKAKIAQFKFKDIDVLIVDQIGKNISGSGMDPNVSGRGLNPGFEDLMNIKKIFVRGLTEETHHNACGIGCADITTLRCVNDVDWGATWINLTTSTELRGGSVPIYANNDREALMIAIRTCNGIDMKRAKVVRIRDTLSLEDIEVSTAYYDELKDNPEIQITSEPFDLRFGEDGYLVD
ncbi:lactate racemase domain-containing protein [uncultured Flavonifractor sp.]|uniref:lactate racemase domain-containing protein n=1 Tax=uncultured Flavonifractor sp. TaxID=1193534 RepID=UPI002639A3D2|nr:lactate racemase domain-containing protein [uncultured Flavonifractor sp.]